MFDPGASGQAHLCREWFQEAAIPFERIDILLPIGLRDLLAVHGDNTSTRPTNTRATLDGAGLIVNGSTASTSDLGMM